VARIFIGVFVSNKLLPAILFACFLLTFPASAQPAQAPVAHAADKADVLTPDQARRALDTLADDKKRAQMIETLRALANAPAPHHNPRLRPSRPHLRPLRHHRNRRYRLARTASARSCCCRCPKRSATCPVRSPISRER
jgi:hypothetical protein